MAKVIVVYGTTTGNTETLAEGVVSGLKKGGAEVMAKNVTEASVDELTGYDGIVLGSSTWGEGELQDDFISFHEAMDKISLTGKKAAVFGPGDSSTYPDTFCTAVGILEKRLEKCGAQLVAEGLKIDGDVQPAMKQAEDWSLKIARSL
ncbi:flavodoxin [bacterium]|nr:flavodoxin [bacterium]